MDVFRCAQQAVDFIPVPFYFAKIKYCCCIGKQQNQLAKNGGVSFQAAKALRLTVPNWELDI